ncbi:DUF397 domain-containing protein [Leucothrix arctica]|uniref:DUF397 domain-containing protein n=1 Tax=Leucothrix arctica TaxID=1481894 RepID=A0A317C8U0_9GAMM|nr:DUF397 domain-containing protein [Leucothrix arctica]PWQ94759.1 DUF397 domain-containing protein [Leucothrix arctica]
MSLDLDFKKSSLCCTDKCCVEVASDLEGNILVRHTEETGKTLSFSKQEWQAFVQGVKQNEFDIGVEK